MDIVIAVGISLNKPDDWKVIIDWTKHIVNRHTISAIDTRISLVTLGSRINIHFKLDKYQNKQDTIDAIDIALSSKCVIFKCKLSISDVFLRYSID